MKTNKLRYVGVPPYVASGQHVYNGNTYRFMVMKRFSTDLQKLFEDAGKAFSKQTVFALALRLVGQNDYLSIHLLSSYVKHITISNYLSLRLLVIKLFKA